MIINSTNPFVHNSAAIDFEWIPFDGEYTHDKTWITSAAFCTTHGKRIVLHISRFKQYPNPERKLIKCIIDNLNKFGTTFGWYSTGVRRYNKSKQKYEGRDSELTMMLAYHNNCLALEIMKYIALYSEMDYYRCCHTGVCQWYSNIYKNMITRKECNFEYRQDKKITKKYIVGGNSVEPKK